MNQRSDGIDNPNLAAARTGQGEQLTTDQGVPVSNDQNTLRAGERGPSLMEDFAFREKITHFDHERIPERVVHARGMGAHGYFQVYEPLTELTKARFLQDPSVRTPVFVRFSNVVGSRGSADTVRDVRGFATKFYTEDGNFDLVGNNIPIFYIQDAVKFPDLIHAAKPEPHNEIPQAASAHDTFWDFISLTPESMAMIMWHISDRALPRSVAMMEGFGIHTFRLVNARGESHFVKFHWKPKLGVHSLLWSESQQIAGKDPDFLRRDLWEAIERGDYPEYELGLQVLREDEEHRFPFDILDATKVWPEELVPVRRVGHMVLDRNPDNFFAETEQAAFHIGNFVPGIEPTDDPLLQGRLFSYLDTQLIRLGGPNFHEIPINRPIAAAYNNQRDGYVRQAINPGRVSYSPNSLGDGRPMQTGTQDGGYVSYPEAVNGPKLRRRSESFADHFSQATLFWNSMSPPEQEHIVLAFRFELGNVTSHEVRERMVDLIANVDMGLASQVAAGIGVADPAQNGGLDGANRRLNEAWDRYGVTARPGEHRPPVIERSAALSTANTLKGTAQGRKVALLTADGADVAALTQLQGELKRAGAVAEVVAPNLGMMSGTNGARVSVDRRLMNAASVLYDAVALPPGQQAMETLKSSGDALHFIAEAYRHCKPIAALGDGVDLLLAADCIGALSEAERDGAALAEQGVIVSRNGGDPSAAAELFVRAIGQHRFFDRPQKDHTPA